jgi:hypothetical protein
VVVGYNRFPHGLCEVSPGCPEPAIFRLNNGKSCKKHKPESIVFAPFLGQQEKFLQRRERVVFFGGAAGGAKSLSLLMKFTQQLSVEKRRFAEARKLGKVHKSTAWGLYLRRTTPNLKQAKSWSRLYMSALDPAATFNEDEGIWKFPSAGGAVLQFSHMEHAKDRFRFKSSAYSFLAFDELTEFEEEMYDYLDTRLRTTDPFLDPYLQICSASNPDGEGLVWVRERFIEIAPPETVVRIETTLGDGRVHAYEQIFIPSKLSDNPILLESGQYEAALRNKRPEVREALLNGNWYVSQGAFFGQIWDSDHHVVEDHDVPQGAKIFRSGDWGIRSPSSICWWYEDADGGLTMFAHLRTVGLTADKVAGEMKKIELRYDLWDDVDDGYGESKLNFARNPLDSACFSNPGMAGAPTIAKDFARCGVRWKPAKKGPGSRYNGLAQMVRRMVTTIPAAFEGATDPTERARPMLRFMRGCKSPIKTIPVIQTDPNDINDVDTKADDHDVDACLGGDTVVRTKCGDFRIKDLVGTSGFVRSFDGRWHAYHGCRKTRQDAEMMQIVFSDGTVLDCTPDHRILCADDTWREARELDTVSYAWLTQSEYLAPSKSGAASGGIFVASIFSAMASAFTGLCSKIRAGASQIVSTFTTLMETARTMPMRTSPSLMSVSTVGFTSPRAGRLERSQILRRLPTRRLPSGIDPTPAANGTASTPREIWLHRTSATSRARYAGRSFGPARSSATSQCAAQNVEPKTEEILGWTISGEPVLSAALNSWRTGMRVATSAPRGALAVVALRPAPRADVYCLTVPSVASFALASGLVVSNCMYACLENAITNIRDDDMDDEDEKLIPRSRSNDRLLLGEPIR